MCVCVLVCACAYMLVSACVYGWSKMSFKHVSLLEKFVLVAQMHELLRISQFFFVLLNFYGKSHFRTSSVENDLSFCLMRILVGRIFIMVGLILFTDFTLFVIFRLTLLSSSI